MQRYIEAFERDDVDAVVAMLTDDATIAMPPTPTWYSGPEAIAAFVAAEPLAGERQWRHLPTRANGQLAVGCYSRDGASGSFTAHVLDVLTLRGAQITAITSFVDPDLFRSFGLPDQLPRRSDSSPARGRSLPVRRRAGRQTEGTEEDAMAPATELRDGHSDGSSRWRRSPR